MRIQSNKVSSLRTRDRIRENGPSFTLIKEEDEVICLDNLEGVLVRSNRTGWEGWFPRDEITIISEGDYFVRK